MRILRLCLSLTILLLAAGGCSLTWINVRDSAEVAGSVRVFLQQHDEEDFRFGVSNLGQQPFSVLIDSIKLDSPRKSVPREAGHLFMGISEITSAVKQGNAPVVQPGQTITVFAHFDLDKAEVKKGDVVRVDFTNVIVQSGQPIPVPPIEFRVK